MENRYAIIGSIRVDRVTRPEALEVIGSMVAARRGGFVVTPNVDHIVLAEQDNELREAYRSAALSLADGKPLLWMARLLGAPLPEKVSGSDLIEPLMARAAAAGWRTFLFGATPAVSAEAARRLQSRHPRLRIVGRDTSPWNPESDAAPDRSPVVRAIRDAKADLVVVALGCPKQERWMLRHARAIGPAVAVGLGGSLDFVAGAVRRAPAWVAEAGMEWAFRLAMEPRRLAYRYLVRDPRIVPIFARTWWHRRRAMRPAASGVPKRDDSRPGTGLARRPAALLSTPGAAPARTSGGVP